jgi:PAS domain S-box-containing protein
MKQHILDEYPARLPAMPCDALRALDAIAHVASQELDLQTLYGVIHREVSKVMECDAFYVCRYDGADDLDFVYQFDEGVLEPSSHERLGNGPTSYCIRNREPFVLTRDNAGIHGSGRYMGQRRCSLSAIHVPLLVDGQPIGVISAQSYRPDAYDESHVRLLGIIAAKAAGAIRNADLRERNRRHEERLSQLAHVLRVREQTLKSVGDLVMTCNADGKITAYNQAVCDALGYGPRELVGQCIIALRTSERGEWPSFRHARNRRITVTAKDGHTVPVLYSTEFLDEEDGRPAGYLVVARNLSDLQRAEEAGRAALALERHRISRDLHDGLVQSLAIAKMQLQLLLRDHALDDATREDLGELQETLTRGLAEARQYIVDLKHAYVESDGLVRAARRYARDFGRVAGLVIEVDTDADESPLGDTEEVHLFYILREALSNVRKHADATSVRVRFRREPDTFRMCVEDDGRGFDLAALDANEDRSEHWGIRHIRERAQALGGCAEIASRPGQGTRICVRLPVAPETT